MVHGGQYGIGLIAALAVILSGAHLSVGAPVEPAAQSAQQDDEMEPGSAEAEAQDESPGTIDITTAETSQDGAPLRITMDLQDAELKDVLKVFSEQSRLNLIAAKEVEQLRVTLFLKNVGVQDALNQILRVNNLLAERLPESDIYVIKAVPQPAADAMPKPVETITRIYALKYAHSSTSILQGAVDALVRRSSPFEASQARVLSTGSGSSSSSAATAGGGSTGQTGIDKVIERLLTDHGKIVTDDRTNSLVVTDVPDNFPRIDAAIRQLDVPIKQVLIEVEVVETTLSKAKQLGFEYGTGSEGTLLTVTPASANTTFPFQYGSGFFGWFKSAAEGAAGAPTTTAGTTGSVATNQLKLVLKALEQDTDTRILARPRVMTLDQQSAVIRLTENTAIAVNETTTTGTAATTTSTIERSITGIVLSVTPQINADGTVTMLVEPSINKPVVSSLTSNGQSVFNPKERSARALVRVKEGNTFVLGGMIDRQEKTVLRKVPLLGDVPLLGALFRKVQVDNTDTELLVFITPNIVRDERPAMGLAMDVSRAREQESTSPASREAAIEDSLSALERERRSAR